MAKQSIKDKKNQNILLWRRFLELQVYLGYDISPYLFIPYSRIKFKNVKIEVDRLEGEYEGGY